MQTRCDELKRMSVQERIKTVREHNLCENCLQVHSIENCPFTATCQKCTKNHHTLLHENVARVMLTKGDETTNSISSDEESDAISKMCAENFYHVSINSSTLLATAVVPLRWNGRSILVNALVDMCATANLISERACKTLNLSIQSANIPMKGVGDSPVGAVIGQTISSFGSIYDADYNLNIASIVVKRIATTPQRDHALLNEWPHVHNLQLANPTFLDSHKIDLLIGAAACSDIMLKDVRKSYGQPIAQQTKLGYIVYGPIGLDENAQTLCYAVQQSSTKATENLTQALQSFWEIEEVNFTKRVNKQQKIFL